MLYLVSVAPFSQKRKDEVHGYNNAIKICLEIVTSYHSQGGQVLCS